MTANSIKLVAIDMDGTLLNEDKIVTKNTIDAIRKLTEKGIRVVIATGRLLESVLAYKEIIDAPISICCTNGSLSFDEDGNEIYNKPINGFQLETAISLLKGEDIYFHLYTRDGIITPYGDNEKSLVKGRMPEGQEHRMKRHIREFDHLVEEGEDIYKIIIIDDDDEKRNKFREILNDSGVKTSSSWSNNIEITDIDANKKEAILRVLHRYNISWEEVAAFGDNENDIPMLEAAAYPFLMGNASQNLKDKTNIPVIDTNDNEGVSKKLVELFDLC